MTPEEPALPEPAVSHLSEPARLAGVLTDPKTAFRDIVTGPRWWVPMILVILLALVFNVTFSRRVGWDRFMEQTFDSNPRTQNMPADQRARAVEQAVRIVSITSYAGAIVGTPVMVAVEAGVLLLIFNFFLGAHLRFKQVFGVTSYALLPMLVSTVLALVVMLLKNPDDFNLRNPLAFNVGAFLDPQSTAKWLVSLGTSLDLFSIWVVILLAIGLAAAAPRLSFSKALTGVMTPWLVLVVLKSAWAGAFG
ncbi:MAG TPA: Yip1 family protein [Bryobacteraceae bacterium]|nr:Yip1 family protein [Bryobacteraceae bacterium]